MVELTSTPILVTIILGVVGLAIPAIDAGRRERGIDRNKLYSTIAFGALIVAMGIVIFRVFTGEVLPAVAFSEGVLVDDLFGSFFAIALLLVSLMMTASSWNYWKGKSNPAAYYSLILLSSIGMILIAYSTDLVMLLVSWELMSIPTYALAAFSKRDPISNEAAIKYFLFGALSSAIIVLAIGLVYGITGTTNIGEALKAFVTLPHDLLPVGLLAIALFIAGFGFKMGLVPFHMWLPDAYEGAPTTISTLLAAGTKKAGFAAALRVIIMGTVALNLEWTFALGIIAIMTMTVGNLAAIMQKNITRMLTYSSIGQAGYILIGLSIAPFSQIGIQASLFHILNHAVMKGASFIAAAGIITTLAVSHLDKIRGLGKRMPITSIGLTISLLALAGVPPLNGFWSKLMLFGSAIGAGSIVSWAPYLAIAGVLNSALSLAYYGWIIRKMYFEEGESDKRVKEPKSIIAVMIFSIIFMVGIGVYPDPIIQFTQSAVPSMTAVSIEP